MSALIAAQRRREHGLSKVRYGVRPGGRRCARGAAGRTGGRVRVLAASVYISGSSAIQPFVLQMGKALAGTTTLVYKSLGSCVGVSSVVLDTTPTGACAAGG